MAIVVAYVQVHINPIALRTAKIYEVLAVLSAIGLMPTFGCFGHSFSYDQHAGVVHGHVTGLVSLHLQKYI